MPQEVKLWRIEDQTKLVECLATKLDLEERLETWIEQDVSIIGQDILIVGRQVDTDFGGRIDLLCLNENGDTVIVELKRGMTPRDVAAQALDYASWVRDLSSDHILKIANGYLGDGTTLENAFAARFGSDLPDVLNQSHSILIVASQIDPSTERIIKYLSEAHGVDINAVTFQCFTTSAGDELLTRVFLVEPDEVEYQSRTKGSSKRRRTLTYEELQEMADEKGVADVYQCLTDRLSRVLRRQTTGSSISFAEMLDGRRRTIVSLIPGESSEEKGLRFQIYLQRFCRFLGVSENDSEVLSMLPDDREDWTYAGSSTKDAEWSGFAGYFSGHADVERFLTGMEAVKAS